MAPRVPAAFRWPQNPVKSAPVPGGWGSSPVPFGKWGCSPSMPPKREDLGSRGRRGASCTHLCLPRSPSELSGLSKMGHTSHGHRGGAQEPPATNSNKEPPSTAAQAPAGASGQGPAGSLLLLLPQETAALATDKRQ